MRKILVSCALFACALCAKAYDIAATVSIEGDTKWYFDIELANNNIDFTAFQMDITLDSNYELKSEDMQLGNLTQSHQLLLAKPGGHYRVVVYNLQNQCFSSPEGRLFSFELDGDIKGITINKIIFAQPDGTEVEAGVYNRALDRINDADAIGTVPEGDDQQIKKVVYDTTGKQVYRIDRRGIYIQNGKKVAVK